MTFTKVLCILAIVVSLALVGKNSFARKDGDIENSIRFQRTTQLNPQAVPLLKSIQLTVGREKIVANIHHGQNCEVVRFWTADPADYRLLYSIQSETYERFESPEVFRYMQENFIYVSTMASGSSGFVTESILWIAPDKTLHPVELLHPGDEYEHQVREDELVLGGGPSLIVSRNKLHFEFYIAKDGDPHCCPTAGKATGVYQLHGAKQYDALTKQFICTFRIIPENFERIKIPQRELAKFNPPSD